MVLAVLHRARAQACQTFFAQLHYPVTTLVPLWWHAASSIARMPAWQRGRVGRNGDCRHARCYGGHRLRSGDCAGWMLQPRWRRGRWWGGSCACCGQTRGPLTGRPGSWAGWSPTMPTPASTRWISCGWPPGCMLHAACFARQVVWPIWHAMICSEYCKQAQTGY